MPTWSFPNKQRMSNKADSYDDEILPNWIKPVKNLENMGILQSNRLKIIYQGSYVA